MDVHLISMQRQKRRLQRREYGSRMRVHNDNLLILVETRLLRSALLGISTLHAGKVYLQCHLTNRRGLGYTLKCLFVAISQWYLEVGANAGFSHRKTLYTKRLPVLCSMSDLWSAQTALLPRDETRVLTWSFIQVRPKADGLGVNYFEHDMVADNNHRDTITVHWADGSNREESLRETSCSIIPCVALTGSSQLPFVEGRGYP